MSYTNVSINSTNPILSGSMFDTKSVAKPLLANPVSASPDEEESDFIPGEDSSLTVEESSDLVPGEVSALSNETDDSFDSFDLDNTITITDVADLLNSLGIKVRYNMLTGKNEYFGIPEELSKTQGAITLPTHLYDLYLRQGRRCPKHFLNDAINYIADENRFNPIEEMLTEKPWDGVNRFDTIYQILGIDATSDASVLLKKWLHQTVAMALNNEEEPYNAAGVLVLQGSHGIGKTMFFRKLSVERSWFAETTNLNPYSKDFVIQTTSVWINELNGLERSNGKALTTMKGFVTKDMDTYRKPYARNAINRPRRTSFCGSMGNSSQMYHRSDSYWIIRVATLDYKKLMSLDKEFFKMLWHQVYETMYLPDPQGFRMEIKDIPDYIKAEYTLYKDFAWNAPQDLWGWKCSTEIKEAIHDSEHSPKAIGMILRDMSQYDDRIKLKSASHKSLYYLPPVIEKESSNGSRNEG